MKKIKQKSVIRTNNKQRAKTINIYIIQIKYISRYCFRQKNLSPEARNNKLYRQQRVEPTGKKKLKQKLKTEKREETKNLKKKNQKN